MLELTSLRAFHGLWMVSAWCCFQAVEDTAFLRMNVCVRCQGPPSALPQGDCAKNVNEFVNAPQEREPRRLHGCSISYEIPKGPADLASKP